MAGKAPTRQNLPGYATVHVGSAPPPLKPGATAQEFLSPRRLLRRAMHAGTLPVKSIFTLALHDADRRL
jgi:hypothetical protein